VKGGSKLAGEGVKVAQAFQSEAVAAVGIGIGGQLFAQLWRGIPHILEHP
jgi:hypothetical protein